MMGFSVVGNPLDDNVTITVYAFSEKDNSKVIDVVIRESLNFDDGKEKESHGKIHYVDLNETINLGNVLPNQISEDKIIFIKQTSDELAQLDRLQRESDQIKSQKPFTSYKS